MQAGKLSDKITINKVVRSADAAGSSTEPTLSTVSVWAAVRQQSAAEKQRNGITATDNAFAVTIRYRDDVDTTASIIYRGRTLAISSVVAAGRRSREWLSIIATEAA